jgi:hypothetical protein
LTRYRTWRGPIGGTIDGTNNARERGISWWIKERYRTMCGHKPPQSAVKVSRLLAFCGNFPSRDGLKSRSNRLLTQAFVQRAFAVRQLAKLRTVTVSDEPGQSYFRYCGKGGEMAQNLRRFIAASGEN